MWTHCLGKKVHSKRWLTLVVSSSTATLVQISDIDSIILGDQPPSNDNQSNNQPARDASNNKHQSTIVIMVKKLDQDWLTSFHSFYLEAFGSWQRLGLPHPDQVRGFFNHKNIRTCVMSMMWRNILGFVGIFRPTQDKETARFWTCITGNRCLPINPKRWYSAKLTGRWRWGRCVWFFELELIQILGVSVRFAANIYCLKGPPSNLVGGVFQFKPNLYLP